MSDQGLVITTGLEAPPPPRRPIHRARWFWFAVIGGAIVVLSTVRVITGAEDIDSSGALTAAIALAMPIGLAGLGGLWSERAGVVNIGLEGMMILGTWGGAFFAYYYGPWVGILGAVLLGIVGGAIHALATVIFGVDHIVSGVAINLLGAGAGAYLAVRTFSSLPGGGPTQSPPLPQLPFISIPWLSDWLGQIEETGWWLVSDIAGVLRALTTNLNVLSIIAVLLLILSWWILWHTPFGLRLRSCGEAPHAAETLGVNVIRYKFMAVLISGGLAGLATMAGWANLTLDKETEDKVEKVYKEGARSVHEEYRKDGSRGEVTVILANGVVVSAEGSRVDMATLKRMVQGLDLARLEATQRTAKR